MSRAVKKRYEIVRAIAARPVLALRNRGPQRKRSRPGAEAVFSLGLNSRVRGKAVCDLGCSPMRRAVTRWIADELV
jgi:hypothetical protein